MVKYELSDFDGSFMLLHFTLNQLWFGIGQGVIYVAPWGPGSCYARIMRERLLEKQAREARSPVRGTLQQWDTKSRQPFLVVLSSVLFFLTGMMNRHLTEKQFSNGKLQTTNQKRFL